MLNQHATTHDGEKYEVIQPIDETKPGQVLIEKTVTKS